MDGGTLYTPAEVEQMRLEAVQAAGKKAEAEQRKKDQAQAAKILRETQKRKEKEREMQEEIDKLRAATMAKGAASSSGKGGKKRKHKKAKGSKKKKKSRKGRGSSSSSSNGSGSSSSSSSSDSSSSSSSSSSSDDDSSGDEGGKASPETKQTDKKKKKASKSKVERLSKQEALIESRTSVSNRIEEMYSALYGQDLNKAESISALFIGIQDKLARDGLTDTKSATGARRYTDWLKMVRQDVQAEFESAVSQIQHQPGAVGHAEKSFVIKMRGLIRQEDKLVRKSDINKLCHKAIEKVLQVLKVLQAKKVLLVHKVYKV